MIRRFLLIVIAMLMPFALLGQTIGKIVGTVTDRETGDALPGANVVIEGTTLGAASNVSGEFIILNVPVGAYSIKASFIGYKSVTLQNVRVSIGLTTEANLALPSEALEVSDVIIIAERPLVNKNATNEVHIITAEQIENLPLRGYTNVAGLQGGVTQIGGTLYVRGGRPEEIQYYVDGVSQNDPFTNNQAGDLISGSIEEVQVQTGGFNAEYGFANSGIIQVSTKTGRSNYTVSGEVITDAFLSKTSEKLGAFGYGYNIGNVAISGPVPNMDRIKFYGAFEVSDFDDRRRSAGVHVTGIETVGFDSTANQGAGAPILGDVALGGGPLPNNDLQRLNWNVNLTFDYKPLRFKVGGNSTRDEFNEFNQLNAAFNTDLNAARTQDTDSYYLKATHTIGSNTFYTATASWFRVQATDYDPRFGSDFAAYGDTTRNSALPAPGNQPRTNDLHARFRPAGTTMAVPNHSKNTNFTFRSDLTHQRGRTHEFKVGFEARLYTVRSYSVSAMRIASARNANPDASEVSVYQSAFAGNIGYDITGQNEINSGIDKPRKPVVAGVYIQDKLEFQDMVVNLGLRWDYFKTDAPTFNDPSNIIITQDGQIDPAQLGDAKVYNDLNPRIGLSFPVTDRTVFHAQYGKFTQPPELDRLFIAYTDFANNLQSGNFTQNENPALKPVKTTSYELGFRQQIGDNAALDITAYYKELTDLVQQRNLTATPSSYALYINGDFGTIKGLSATFELRRTNRVAATAQYTLQIAAGTGSDGADASAINWLGTPPVYPTFVAPLDFDQRHTGAINLDFRTLAGDGPEFGGGHPFGRMGLNLLFTFHSGRPYTPGQQRSAIFDTGPAAQNRPQAEINSANEPFLTNLDAKWDKSFTFGNIDFNVYLWAINLLGSEGIRNVYDQSGEAHTDGYLQTPQGQVFTDRANDPLNSTVLNPASFYTARVNNPFNFEQPRQYRLGLRFNFR